MKRKHFIKTSTASLVILFSPTLSLTFHRIRIQVREGKIEKKKMHIQLVLLRQRDIMRITILNRYTSIYYTRRYTARIAQTIILDIWIGFVFN